MNSGILRRSDTVTTISNAQHLARVLGKSEEHPWIMRAARIGAAYALGRQCYLFGKERYQKYQAKRNQARTYTIAIEEDDPLYENLYGWVVANTRLSDQHAAVAKSVVVYKESGDGYNESQQAETSIKVTYDGEYAQDVVLNGHKIKVAIAKKALPGPKKKDDDGTDDAVAVKSPNSGW